MLPASNGGNDGTAEKYLGGWAPAYPFRLGRIKTWSVHAPDVAVFHPLEEMILLLLVLMKLLEQPSNPPPELRILRIDPFRVGQCIRNNVSELPQHGRVLTEYLLQLPGGFWVHREEIFLGIGVFLKAKVLEELIVQR